MCEGSAQRLAARWYAIFGLGDAAVERLGASDIIGASISGVDAQVPVAGLQYFFSSLKVNDSLTANT